MRKRVWFVIVVILIVTLIPTLYGCKKDSTSENTNVSESTPQKNVTVEVEKTSSFKTRKSDNKTTMIASLGKDLAIYDVSKSSGIKEIREIPLDDSYGYMVTSEDHKYAFITNGHKVIVLNVESPNEPKKISEISLKSKPYVKGFSMCIYKNYLIHVRYGNEHENDMTVIDISNPSTMKVIRNLDGMGGFDIAIYKNYAYVINLDEGLSVIDLSNPTNPRKIKTLSEVKGVFIYLNGQYAFVTGLGEMIVVDLTTPTNPVTNNVREILIRSNIVTYNNYLYFTDEEFLKVYNARNVQSLALIRKVRIPHSSYNYIYLDKVNNKIFISSSESKFLTIVDISNPKKPKLIGFYPGCYYQTISVGNIGLAIGKFNALKVFDVKDTQGIKVISTLKKVYESNKPFKEKIILYDNYLYTLHNEKWVNYEMKVIDVSDPNKPVMRNKLDVRGWDMGIYKHYMAIIYDGLYIVDISKPEKPTLVATTSDAMGYSLAIYKDYAFIPLYNKLQVVSLKKPKEPKLIGKIELPINNAMYIDSCCEYAVVSGNYGIVVINISDPTNPEVTSSLEMKGGKVKVNEDYAYILTGASVLIVNMEDKEAPYVVSSYSIKSPMDPRGMYVYGDKNRLYISGIMNFGDGGTIIEAIDITDKESPKFVGSYWTNINAAESLVGF